MPGLPAMTGNGNHTTILTMVMGDGVNDCLNHEPQSFGMADLLKPKGLRSQRFGEQDDPIAFDRRIPPEHRRLTWLVGYGSKSLTKAFENKKFQ